MLDNWVIICMNETDVAEMSVGRRGAGATEGARLGR